MNYYLEYKDTKILCRPKTSDEFIAREILDGEYRKLKIGSEDIIADIGMNIGSFTVWALDKGAKMIYGFEPVADNFAIAEHNIKINGKQERARPFNLAVTGTDEKKRAFSINLKKNKGAHSLVAKRGRKTVAVDCININEILSKYKPTIVKMDIEGGEYECLPAVKSWTGVRELILEFHHAHLNDVETHEKYIEMLRLLKSKFPYVHYRDPSVIGGAWTGIIHCKDTADEC